MSLVTNLKGRIRNTNLPRSHGLMPVFEAVVNSIQAIEDSPNSHQGTITLEIVRQQGALTELDSKIKAPISGFVITDNGCGFNEKNFQSFETLDSDYKIDKGCRGLGRLIWLKVFESATISSTYAENATFRKREFIFNESSAISSHSIEDINSAQYKTIVTLKNFEEKYRGVAPKDAYRIADSLLEHILWYFVREGSSPEIILRDDQEEINLSSLFERYMADSAETDTIDIGGYSFDLTHIKFRNIHSLSSKSQHKLAWCASNRLVKEEVIRPELVPGLYGSLKDTKGDFYYTCYITSNYLNDRVASERTGFNIDEDVPDMLGEISFKHLRLKVTEKSAEFLEPYLEDKITASIDRIENFVSDLAPQYRPIIGRMKKEDLIVDPEITNEKLDVHLHKQKYKLENEILNEGHGIMKPKENESHEDYSGRLTNYLQKVQDIKKSDLANYVSHRRVIIDLLRKSLDALANGKHEKEEVIHRLIMPMIADSDNTSELDCNLWLVDERLAFHNYLASDKTLNSMPITDSVLNKEPDILSLRVFDNPLLVSADKSPPFASLTIVEIKRPMRNDVSNDEDKDPIFQCLNYLEKIRSGKVTTKNNRPINAGGEIPGYCYVLCDLTPTMIKRCKHYDLQSTSDGMGYFGYHKSYSAYIEVISFDQLVKGATERNSAFFHHLGIPST